MRHLKPLLLLVFAGVCLATPVTYANTSVTCREFAGGITELLTVTVDPAVNGGIITAGTGLPNNNSCFFYLAGNVLSAPFTNGTYNYNSPLDVACHFTGGICLTGISPMTLSIAPVQGGQLFTIVASSITTTFTLSGGSSGGGGGGGSPVPEPGNLMLLGSGLTAFGLVARKRLSKS